MSFREFMQTALYSSGRAYYAARGQGEDYATAPHISPVFGFALARLVSEFASRRSDGLCSIVDIGCGDGTLLETLISELPAELASRCQFWGVDRIVEPGVGSEVIRFTRNLGDLPSDAPLLVISNELFDALPFARLVQRPDGLRELHVTGRDGALDWEEKPAGPEYIAYFAGRSIRLEEGQFADVSLDWSSLYSEICRLAPTAMIVTFDYGYLEQQLFDHRVRRFGTAAAYSRHQVSRDLLRTPSEQDLTAHINFTDLIRAGEAAGFQTLSFLRQAEFLLRIGVSEHPLFAPADEVNAGSLDEAVHLIDEREAARRLVLPDGIGEDIKVLVQARGVPLDGWSFQRRLIA